MTVIFADTETLNAREGRAIGVEDKIRVRVLLVGKKATSPEAHGWHRRRTSPRRISAALMRVAASSATAVVMCRRCLASAREVLNKHGFRCAAFGR
jgi:hypothetical protein